MSFKYFQLSKVYTSDVSTHFPDAPANPGFIYYDYDNHSLAWIDINSFSHFHTHIATEEFSSKVLEEAEEFLYNNHAEDAYNETN